MTKVDNAAAAASRRTSTSAVPRKDWRPWVTTFLVLAAVATFALWLTRGWVAIGVPHFDPRLEPFSDAFVVLWGPEQCAAGNGVWIKGACFVPSAAAEAHAQTYEPWLTFFRWGLGSDHHVPVSVVMIALFYLAMALTLKPASAGELCLCLLLLATPAVQLGVERANFDLLICAMICLAAWLLGRDRPIAAAAGALVLAMATMLKIYTGLACAFAWVIARSPRSGALVAAAGATVLAIAVLGPETIAALDQGAPEGTTRFSTGAHWLFRQRGPVAAWSVIVLALIAAGAGFALLRKAPAPRFDAWPYRAAAFNAAFLVAVPLFFLKDSFDYRMVLWLPCLALPLAWLRGGVHRDWRRIAAITVGLYLVTAGAEWPCFLLDAWARNRGAGWTPAAVSALIYVKQAAAWLLVAALMLIFGFGMAQKIAVFTAGGPPWQSWRRTRRTR